MRIVNLSYFGFAPGRSTALGLARSKTWLQIFVAIASIGGAAAAVHAYEAFRGPTELIQYDPAKASPGYTMFSPFRGQNTYLIDMQGNVVHYWPYPKDWSSEGEESVEKHARLLRDGTLLRGTIDHRKGSMRGAVYQLIDWGGEVVWQYDEERPGYTPHHDARMIWNPKLEARTLLYTASKEMTHEAVRWWILERFADA